MKQIHGKSTSPLLGSAIAYLMIGLILLLLYGCPDSGGLGSSGPSISCSSLCQYDPKNPSWYKICIDRCEADKAGQLPSSATIASSDATDDHLDPLVLVRDSGRANPLEISWSLQPDNLDLAPLGYKIYRDGDLIGMMPQTVFVFVDHVAERDQSHCYGVAAFFETGDDIGYKTEACTDPLLDQAESDLQWIISSNAALDDLCAEEDGDVSIVFSAQDLWVAVDPSGQITWQAGQKEIADNQLSNRDSSFFFSTADGLSVLDETGDLIWSYDLPGVTFKSVAFGLDKSVYAATEDQQIFAFNPLIE
jgi:hypothetical protein